MALICLFILAVVAVATAIFYQNKNETLETELEVAAMFVASSVKESRLLHQDIERLELDDDDEEEDDIPVYGEGGLLLEVLLELDPHLLHRLLLELPQGLPVKGWIPPELLSWLNKKEGEEVLVYEVVRYLQ